MYKILGEFSETDWHVRSTVKNLYSGQCIKWEISFKDINKMLQKLSHIQKEQRVFSTGSLNLE